jgi:ketosteroid isomerase-like protein
MRAVAGICAVALAVGLGACGGDHKADAQGVVRDFTKAVNAHDGKAVCTKLVTREFVENSTFSKGQAAERQCQSQISSLRQPPYRVVGFTRTEVHGDKATVTAVLDLRGVRHRQVFDLEKQDGSFRVTTGRPQ